MKNDTVEVNLTLNFLFTAEDKQAIVAAAEAQYAEYGWGEGRTLADEVDDTDPNALFDRSLIELLIGSNDEWATRIPGDLLGWDDIVRHKRVLTRAA